MEDDFKKYNSAICRTVDSFCETYRLKELFTPLSADYLDLQLLNTSIEQMSICTRMVERIRKSILDKDKILDGTSMLEDIGELQKWTTVLLDNMESVMERQNSYNTPWVVTS